MNKDTTAVLFPVCARADVDRMELVVDALKKVGIEVWRAESLQPGSNFQNQISEAIKAAAGALVFVSQALAESQFVRRELETLISYNKPILPLILEQGTKLPLAVEYLIAPFQQIHLPTSGSPIPIRTIEQIRDFVLHASREDRIQKGDAPPEAVREVAATLASAVRKDSPAGAATTKPPTSVFIVHGHDDHLLKEVEDHLSSLGIEPVVLRRIGGPAQSLFQKFMQWGSDTRFALVLLSADDLGASRAEYEAEGGDVHALQFRARQNVIMELGFFYGHLGWENVFVLFQKANKVFPRFERPSDLDGVVFDMVDDAGQWKGYLDQKLKDAGFLLG